MAKIIEAKAVISAEDRTGAVFEKIAKKMDVLAKTSKTAKAVDAVSKSLERAKAQMTAIEKFDTSRGDLVGRASGSMKRRLRSTRLHAQSRQPQYRPVKWRRVTSALNSL